MSEEEIHNIYLHMSGKAEGLVEATGKADFPVLFARAILEYSKKQWVGLTDEQIEDCFEESCRIKVVEPKDGIKGSVNIFDFGRAIEAKLKERNT